MNESLQEGFTMEEELWGGKDCSGSQSQRRNHLDLTFYLQYVS